MSTIPEYLFVFNNSRFIKPIEMKLVVFLSYSKYDNPAVSICESRIALPKTTGKTAFSRFELSLRRFTKSCQTLDSIVKEYSVFFHSIYD